MKNIISIRRLVFLICASCFSLLAEELKNESGFGSAKHFRSVGNLGDKDEHVISSLTKEGVDYKLVQTNTPSMEVRKYTSEVDYETFHFLLPGSALAKYCLGNRLVDIYIDNKNKESSIVLSQAQKYIYLKSVKNYEEAPAGKFFYDNPFFLRKIWKPVFSVHFVPPELDPIYFSQKIGEYNSAALTGISTFELRYLDSDNNEKIDIYSFSNDGIEKNGVKFEKSVSVHERELSSQVELLNTVDNLADEAVLAEKENILASGILETLSSFDDLPRAQAVKARIEALIND